MSHVPDSLQWTDEQIAAMCRAAGLEPHETGSNSPISGNRWKTSKEDAERKKIAPPEKISGETRCRDDLLYQQNGQGWEDGQIVPSADFDLARVDAALLGRGREPDPTDEYQIAGEILGDIVQWLADSKDIQSAGLRAFALVLATRPQALGVRSGAELAERLGVSRAAINQRVSELRDLTGGRFKTGLMKSNGARKIYSGRAKAVHARKNETDQTGIRSVSKTTTHDQVGGSSK
ncbi:MAG: hypothetical protein ACK4UN_16030 [Limisphaerales bacterium]